MVYISCNSISDQTKGTSSNNGNSSANLNQIPRLYIYEGVYAFDSYLVSFNTVNDKFGEPVTTSKTEYYGAAEVSFKSDKIVILLKNYKEEIFLGEPYIRKWLLSEDHIQYLFPIIKWHTFINTSLAFTFDSTENQQCRKENKSNGIDYFPPSLELTIERKTIEGKREIDAKIRIFAINAYKQIIGGRKIVPLLYSDDRQYRPPSVKPTSTEVIPGLNSFKIVPYLTGSKIEMNNLKYRYEDNSKSPYYARARVKSD